MAIEILPIPILFAIVVAVLALAIVGIGTLCAVAVRLFTVPGVVVHEFAHASACRLVGVRVLEVVYFQFGDPAGYVRHEQPRRYREAFVVSVAPFLVNTIVAFVAFLGLATLVAASDVASLGDVRTISREPLAVGAGLAWLGLSVGIHAFPSTGDADVLWTRSRLEWRRSPLVLLGLPVVAVIYVANVLSWLWADVLYALGLLALAFALVGVPV
ncbi:DUF3267 domain-containing protein [Natrarchaeobius chitinivorans]|uniref:DUF3267 domain-containing protein n=1 Tax=Natrarchaeobius chitinivorans TaxID=1679083 RepID=A0A3N6LWM5_NATCH|nr:DUF3267 domain-containing protein [Natrarchaeobius chitinivorans]RQG92104.1 DUF3267 domain-containing protein [Natrarchaeobius chitinivorans]